ncbi:MAG: hypothetical protein K2X48_14335 [Chitinophagaceae bacterium]|nr:hypothetical protein [Chitinophagaceae bacterium]
MKLFRAISSFEFSDFEANKFRCTERTISAKQFFKSRKAAEDFVSKSIEREYEPPYQFIIEIEVTEEDLNKQWFDEQVLDTHKALTVYEVFAFI